MLKPDVDRLDYGEQLCPPKGFELDAAIATTYNLDLNALLTVPIALCFSDTLDGDLKGEKLALLEAIGQVRDKVTVFYQKGNIAIPSQFNRLFTLLEPCLQAVVPSGGAFSSFHPKLWLLRFIESEPVSKTPQVCYRLLVLSRNLTFDRSWDVAVSLDGELVGDKKELPLKGENNLQFLGFIKDLIEEGAVTESNKTICDELPKIKWKAPDDFEFVNLLVGGGERGKPIEFEATNNDEIMVVSPFLKGAGKTGSALKWLAELAPNTKERYLFSRAEELNAVGKMALGGEDWQYFAFNERLVASDETHELTDSSVGDEPKSQNLHAKLIIQQQNQKAYWHVGSANATNAAMGKEKKDQPRNTEIMVSMVGRSKKVGPKLLREQWVADGLFIEHEFAKELAEGSNALERLLREAMHTLIKSNWLMRAVPAKGETYTLSLMATNLEEALNVNMSVWVSQLAISGEPKKLKEDMKWEKVSLTDISAFVHVCLVIEDEGERLEKNFLIETTLEFEGDDKREQQIMNSLVDTPEKLINYLNLLLQVSPEKHQWLSFEENTGMGSGEVVLAGNPILEQLLIASSRHPKLLVRVADSLDRLKAANVSIPDDFSGLWEHFKKELPK